MSGEGMEMKMRVVGSMTKEIKREFDETYFVLLARQGRWRRRASASSRNTRTREELWQ
jgi:hypothetical protein